MTYITVKSRTTRQLQPELNFEDLIRQGLENFTLPTAPVKQYYKTYTFQANPEDNVYRNLLERYPLPTMKRLLTQLDANYRHFLKDDMSEYYSTFYIPKHSGGMRRIDAPLAPLMDALTNVKNTFEHHLYVSSHNAAHAYTPQRSTVTAMKLHQQNESKWFLKLDLKDFFPSHNHQYIMKTLETIFPFSALMTDDVAKRAISNLIKLGLLNDKLPQGTPLSPLLTNILMVPIDTAIEELLKVEQRQHFTYTRYADDLLISSKYHFKWSQIQTKIRNILTEKQTPFALKEEKTRYGSSAGRNWNLGIMLNKDNNLTIGHKQNQRFRAMVFNFLQDLTNGRPWDKIDVQVMLGQISYYRAIEPEYVDSTLTNYSTKFNTDFMRAAKDAIK